MIKLIPIHHAEAIFLPFWDKDISPLQEMEKGQGIGEWRQDWIWSELAWAEAKPGETLGTLQKNMNLDITGYDGIVLSASLPVGVMVKVDVKIDGEWQMPICEGKGNSNIIEYAGSVKGGNMEYIRISFRSESGNSGTSGLFLLWGGVSDTERMKFHEAYRPKYIPDYETLMVPEGKEGKIIPSLGVFFSGEELEKMRAKAKLPGYKKYVDTIRAEAKKWMAINPESLIGTYTCNGGYTARVKDKPGIGNHGGANSVGAKICSFVGLLDEDAGMLRQGVKFALALAYTEKWCGGFMESFPGSTWHQRSFMEYCNIEGCVLALDFAGGMLTESGKKLIRLNIYQKGIARIQQDLLEHEYVWHCNQGPSFANAWLLALLSMVKDWPRVKDYFPMAEYALIESLLENLNEDGGVVEGPLYGAILARIPSLYAYARYQGIPFDAYMKNKMKDKFFKFRDYIIMMLREGKDCLPGSIIPVGDVGKDARLSTWPLVNLYAATKDPLFQALSWESIENYKYSNGELEDCLILLLGPEDKPEKEVPRAIFTCLNNTGYLGSKRESRFGIVSFYLIGSSANAGHCHDEKGSFIIDVDGEMLACDRGIYYNYSDPRCNEMMAAERHNMLVPAVRGNSFVKQLNPCPVPIPVIGSENKGGFESSIDATPCWNGIFKKHIRKVTSDSPASFIITDEVEFDGDEAVTFNLNTVFPISRIEGGWIVKGERSGLKITPRWAYAHMEVFVDSIDREEKAVNHLKILSKQFTSAILVTELEIVEL